jgi:hypothetical protein
VTFEEAIFDLEVLSDDIATLAQSAFQGLDPVGKFPARENADAMNRLLWAGLHRK